MTDDDIAWFIQQETLLQADYAPHIELAGNLGLLIKAGVPAYAIKSIAEDAIWIYGVNRKGPKSHAGPIQRSGEHIWQHLTRKDDDSGDFDLGAFAEYRPVTIEAVVAKTHFGVSTVKNAIQQLVEHGFADRKRDGRSFPTKLLVPALALVEYADAIAEDNPRGGSVPREMGIDLKKLGETIKGVVA